MNNLCSITIEGMPLQYWHKQVLDDKATLLPAGWDIKSKAPQTQNGWGVLRAMGYRAPVPFTRGWLSL